VKSRPKGQSNSFLPNRIVTYETHQKTRTGHERVTTLNAMRGNGTENETRVIIAKHISILHLRVHHFEAASDTKLCVLALQSIFFPVFGRKRRMFLNVLSCICT